MTNKEASKLARRIPFAADWPVFYPDTAAGLWDIVNKQLRRIENKRLRTHKVTFQAQLDQFVSRKAPGHDAAVKADKARVADGYDMAAAGDATVEANYQADKATYYRGRGR